MKFAHAVRWVDFDEGVKTFTVHVENLRTGATESNEFEEDGVHSSNGVTRAFDAVIMCTGYIHHYPFLPNSLSLSSPNNVYPDNLYRGVVWEKNNQLFCLGAQGQWFTFTMFDAQAWCVRDLIEQTDYPMFDLDAVCGIFKQWIQSKRDDILNSRDVSYPSVMTGTTAEKHHTPWMLELDSSVERYLSTPARDDARDIFEGREPAAQRS